MWSGLDGYSAPPIWTTLISGKSPPPLQRGVYCQAALNDLGYINQLWVLVDQRVAFVSQLFGTHRGNFFRQERHEEVIITQMEVIRKLSRNVQVGFFWSLDTHHFRLAGRWLYYGLYRMLVLTSGGSLLTGGV